MYGVDKKLNLHVLNMLAMSKSRSSSSKSSSSSKASSSKSSSASKASTSKASTSKASPSKASSKATTASTKTTKASPGKTTKSTTKADKGSKNITNDKLRSTLKTVGLPTSGNKQQLLDRLSSVKSQGPTNDTLRTALKNLGLPSSGNKSDLLHRLQGCDGKVPVKRSGVVFRSEYVSLPQRTSKDTLMSKMYKNTMLNTQATLGKNNITVTPRIRNLVWTTYSGSKTKSDCGVCEKVITKSKHHCSHVKSKYDGGDNSVGNLRPLCAKCNLAMGTQHMVKYCKENHPNAPVLATL